jgi:hypothetical protein
MIIVDAYYNHSRRLVDAYCNHTRQRSDCQSAHNHNHNTNTHDSQAVVSDVTVGSTRRSSTGENMVTVMVTMTIEGDPGTGQDIVKALTQESVAANIPAGSGIKILNMESVVSTSGEACMFAKKLTWSQVMFLCVLCMCAVQGDVFVCEGHGYLVCSVHCMSLCVRVCACKECV